MNLGELRAQRERLAREFDEHLLALVEAGTTQQEIADRLGTTQQAVSALIRRARTRRTVAA